MIKILLTLLLISIFTIIPSDAFAANGLLVSGPSGTQVNGWYSSIPTVRVDTSPACPTGASGNVGVILIHEDGLHKITLRSHLNGYPRIYRDDDVNGRGTTGEIFACSAVSTPYTGDDPEIFWQGDIKLDTTLPKISIDSPSNNSNTEGGNVVISGSVSDNLSGIWNVSVNGVSAKVSGTSYSVSLPIVVGLNSITAIAKDQAGNSTSTPSIIINRTTTSNINDQSEPSRPTPNKSNSQQATTETASGTNSAAQNEQANDNISTAAPPSERMMLVNDVVRGGGIGLTTLLAIAVILLVLDKLSILRIKALNKMYDRLFLKK